MKGYFCTCKSLKKPPCRKIFENFLKYFESPAVYITERPEGKEVPKIRKKEGRKGEQIGKLVGRRGKIFEDSLKYFESPAVYITERQRQKDNIKRHR